MPKREIDFGAPEEGDATASFERMAIESSIEANRFLATEAEKVLNRPMGSKPVSRKEQQEEFEMYHTDPEFMVGMYQSFLGKHGGNKMAALTDMMANYVRPNLLARQRRERRAW